MRVSAGNALLSQNVRFLRKRKKMSRAAFANYIGINSNQLFCLEKELIDYIYFKALNNLSEIYGIPADEILSENLEKKYAGKRFHYSR